MSSSIHNINKGHIGKLRAALYDCDAARLREQLRGVFAPDCEVHLAHPLEDLDGVGVFEPDARIDRGAARMMPGYCGCASGGMLVIKGLFWSRGDKAGQVMPQLMAACGSFQAMPYSSLPPS